MSSFKFNSRETYLAYVAAWKYDYAELSKTQREERKLLKQQQREGNVYAWKLQNSTRSRRYDLSQMIVERHLAKIEAQRQYEEAKVESTCAG